MEFRSAPRVWDAAYSAESRFSREDVQDVVEYARQRAIRVLLEFDVPGHADSWCKGYPEVCPSPSCTSPLNPANNSTFELLDKLVAETAAELPEQLLHLGGDEVDYKCWENTPAIASWMQQHHLNSVQTYGFFLQQAEAVAAAHQRRPIHWVEAYERLGRNLSHNAIVHVWKSRDTVQG